MTDFERIASEIGKAVPIASATPQHPEGKLRELISPLWQQWVKSNRIDLNFHPRDERILANGRADTTFNRLILEYKKPGVIKSDNAKNRQLIAQVKGYIEDLAKEERWKHERLLGVAFDGNYFLYVRKVGRWIEDEPIPVNAESVEFFLLNLEKLTSKKALIPDNLIQDFAIGADSRNFIASNLIKAFYFALTSNKSPKVKVFFEQWALQFAEVHGAIENKKFDAQTLFDSYGFNKKEQKDFSFLAFFFALDSYYGLLMKLLAYQVVGFYTLKDLAGLPLTDWEKLDSDDLKEKLTKLEDGGIFRSDPLNIRNFLEGDLLSWYLQDWDTDIERAIKTLVDRLNQYDPETMELVPDETRDILKKLYQFLVPKVIRHDLGEYYTPDWLAERCLNQVGYGPKDPDLLKKRVLDPGCGSGTFVVLAIKRAREHARLKGISPTETLTAITRNIMGFDLNPLAVISARTNYLLAIADLLKYKKGEVTIPIYLCDSINPPSAKVQQNLFDPEAGQYLISTSVGVFHFPDVLVRKEFVQKVAEQLEDSVKRGLSTEKFLTLAKSGIDLEKADVRSFDSVLGKTFEKLVELDQKGINGVWARIIKNAFAPLFVGRFDFVVGNPPWVNWEDLPQSYRDQTKFLWQSYGLFSLSGGEARLGGGKKDISMLMLYVSVDKYLKDKGKLCVVITQTLFKTQGAGDGFRRFQIGNSERYFRVDQLDDLVELQPFEGATNRTAVLAVTNGSQTKYPVPYLLWKKKQIGRIGIDFSFSEVLETTDRMSLQAQPVDGSDTSPWLAARPNVLRALSKVIGQSEYRAYEGANTGGANGIYWVDILGRDKDNVEIANMHDIGKKKVSSVCVVIEDTLVYPLLRGRDVQRWNATPSGWHIIAQDPRTRQGYTSAWMTTHCPKTGKYFERFETELRSRAAFKKYQAGTEIWSQFNVGQYTFSPYKVVWTRVGTEIKSAVVSHSVSANLPSRSIVPIETVVFVPFNDQNEAFYFCALLNSSPSRLLVSSYSNKSSGSFGSPHILTNICIPAYDKKDQSHVRLGRLSQLCHEKTRASISIVELENEIDELAGALWNLSKIESQDIKNGIEELR